MSIGWFMRFVRSLLMLRIIFSFGVFVILRWLSVLLVLSVVWVD